MAKETGQLPTRTAIELPDGPLTKYELVSVDMGRAFLSQEPTSNAAVPRNAPQATPAPEPDYPSSLAGRPRHRAHHRSRLPLASTHLTFRPWSDGRPVICGLRLSESLRRFWLSGDHARDSIRPAACEARKPTSPWSWPAGRCVRPISAVRGSTLLSNMCAGGVVRYLAESRRSQRGQR
jgi:hypothetical protein